MRQKALEIRKAQTLERIEKKLDLLAKALKVDFSQLESTPAPTPEPEAVAAVNEPENPVESPAETAPEREEIAPEAKTRSRNK